jgi:hypothetical protein
MLHIETEIAMSAYLIFTRDKTLDEHELSTYVKEVQSTSANIGKCVNIVSEGRHIGSHWWLESEELKPLTVHPEWPNRNTGDSRVEETF